LLRDCLTAIEQQTCPPHEVIVAVGPSADGTREVARAIARESDRIAVIDNAAGDRASALNSALERATGDVIAFVDAQSRLARDYLERALVVMAESGAPIVGGPMRPRGSNLIGQTVARALVSPFGIGDSAFHFSESAGDADSVYLGVYRRHVFETVGRYDETLLRTEDDDFNQRARQAGFRIRLDPRIRSTYLCRDSLGALFRQYHGYGYWKVALFVTRPGSFRIRHAVPGGAVLAALILGIVSVVARRPHLAFVAAGYAAIALAFEARIGGRRSFGMRMIFPVVTATMHLGYGLGSIQGALRLWRPLVSAIGSRRE
jgi:glycosyltransferase involved in cell wall biosynthesis